MNRLFRQAVSITMALIMVLGLATAGVPAYAEENQEQAALQAAQPVTLLAGNSTWKYADDGTDQSTAWRAVYDDTSWKSGQAPLGYKNDTTEVSTQEFGKVQTKISYGADKSNKYRTTYFRTNLTATAEQLAHPGQFLGTLAFDDGVVLYLNGQEIYRAGMPAGEITYLSESTFSNSDPNLYSKVDLTEAVKANLKAGSNELSAEVHQANGGSSDVYWDMSLLAVPAPEPVVPGVGKET